MKKFLLMIMVLGTLVIHSCGPVYVVHQDPVPGSPPVAPPPVVPPPENDPEVSYQSFYDELSPYGHWVDYPGYGYAWMPEAGPDFKPYATNGHWVYTEEGWTWASDYRWGWATFHYGRWFYADNYGWMWVPGKEWAPAWVSWRRSSDYYGWAPLGPNTSIGGSYGGGYNPPTYYWNFVPNQYIANPNINNYYVNESRNVTIINNTTVINNTTIINNNNGGNNNRNYRGNYSGYGPDLREVERVSGNSIRPVVIRPNSRPGEQLYGGQMDIYRPRVSSAPQTNAGGRAPGRIAPSRIESVGDLRPVTRPAFNDNRNNDNRNNDNRNNDNRNNNVGNNGYNRVNANPGNTGSYPNSPQPNRDTRPANNPFVPNSRQPAPANNGFNNAPANPANNNFPSNNGNNNSNTNTNQNTPGVNPRPSDNARPGNDPFMRRPVGQPGGNYQPGGNNNQPGWNNQPGRNNQNEGNYQPGRNNPSDGNNQPGRNNQSDGNTQPVRNNRPEGYNPNFPDNRLPVPTNNGNYVPSNNNPANPGATNNRVGGYPNWKNNQSTNQQPATFGRDGQRPVQVQPQPAQQQPAQQQRIQQQPFRQPGQPFGQRPAVQQQAPAPQATPATQSTVAPPRPFERPASRPDNNRDTSNNRGRRGN